ncbi:MAG: peptidylprolyl isomerase [Chloroflexota bacterium]
MVTTLGTFTVYLYSRVAPITVNNFVFLARHHFYDGVLFHRIIKDFMVQTGDPLGTGFGGPGYHFQDEKVKGYYTRGTLAMANSGPNTNGSQFFIVVVPPHRAASLKPNYTIFGRVLRGMSVVQKIANTPVGPNPGTGEASSPLQDVYLKKVIIHQAG